MYSKISRTVMTSGTAIWAYCTRNTVPAPTTHHLIIEIKNPDKAWAIQAEERNASLRVQLEWAESRAQQVANMANTLQLQVIDLTDKLKRETAERVKLADDFNTERGIHAARMEYCQGIAQIWADQLNGQTQLAAEYAEHYDSQAKDKNQIAGLVEENIAQQGTITELKATIEQLHVKHADELKATIQQLEGKHANNLKSIDNDLKDLAGCMAKEQVQADAEQNMLNERVELAEGHVKRLEIINKLYANRAERVTKRCQLYAERAKQANETAGQYNLTSGLEQPAGMRNVELTVNRAEIQDELRIESACKAKDIIREGMMASKLNVMHTKPKTFNGLIDTAKNKITRSREMAHKVVELLRAHQCRRQLNNSKPESDFPTAKSQRSAIAFSSMSAKLLY
ncbi:hypothetical protein GGH96_003667 [Coemansia sp. RSA 1972]|nr:hypothetical protein GGH96_003667 [Coemansia sp. RSA 1972]